MSEVQKVKAGWRIATIAAAGAATLGVITLDNITNIWQYGMILICVVFVLFSLVVNWNAVVRGFEDEDTVIEDIWEYKNRW